MNRLDVSTLGRGATRPWPAGDNDAPRAAGERPATPWPPIVRTREHLEARLRATLAVVLVAGVAAMLLRLTGAGGGPAAPVRPQPGREAARSQAAAAVEPVAAPTEPAASAPAAVATTGVAVTGASAATTGVAAPAPTGRAGQRSDPLSTAPPGAGGPLTSSAFGQARPTEPAGAFGQPASLSASAPAVASAEAPPATRVARPTLASLPASTPVATPVAPGLVAAATAAAPAARRSHTVRPGDTLLAIALRNNTTVDALVAANNLKTADTILSIGQRLLVP